MGKNIVLKVLMVLVCFVMTIAVSLSFTACSSMSNNTTDDTTKQEQQKDSKDDEKKDMEDFEEKEEDDDEKKEEEKKSTAIVLTSPEDKSIVKIIDDDVKEYLTATSSINQLRILEEKKGACIGEEKVTLSWEKDDSSSYTIHLADNSNFNNEVIYSVSSIETSVSLYNLMPATTYYWKVQGTKSNDISEVRSFTTDDVLVRLIFAEGGSNIRDLGGWNTELNGNVKYSLLYRGALLEDGLTEDGKEMLSSVLGIKSEIDLRSDSTITSSSISETTTFVKFGIGQYDQILESSQYNSLKSIFEFLADENNYPIYFHCRAGADRTGTLAFLVNGLLGVSYDDLVKDFELTSFSAWGARYRSDVVDNDFGNTGVFQNDADNYVAFGKLYNTIMSNYGGEGVSLSEAIETFLIDYVGVDYENIENIKSIMLNDYQKKIRYSLSNSQDILLTEDMFSISLGNIEYDEIISIKCAGVDLGNSLNNISTSLISNLVGEKKVVISAKHDGENITIYAPVVIITKALTTLLEIQDAVSNFAYDDEKGSNAYYIIANDIIAESNYLYDNLGYKGDTAGWVKSGSLGKGFHGTLDGRNHVITGFRYTGSLFGNIGDGAVIKNITFNELKSESGNAVFTTNMRNTTIENVIINYVENSTINAVISSTHVYYSNFKNIVINAPNGTIDTLFGTGDLYECKLDNISVTAKSLRNIGGQNTNLVTIDNKNVTATLTGIEKTLADAIVLANETTEIDLGLVFANANVKITFNSKEVNATVNENGIVSFTNSDLFIHEDSGENVIKITGSKDSLTFTILLTVNVDNGVTKLTVESSQDLIMSNDTVSLSMGDYAGYTVTAIKLGSYDLGTNASSLDVSLLKEDLTKHGVQTVIVKATYEGNEYEITYPVVVVTKALTTLLEIQEAVGIYAWNGDKGANAYYILANDIDTNGLDSNHTNLNYKADTDSWVQGGDLGKGFHGTLDGRNHKISGFRVNVNGGLFGNVGDGAVIKNITFENIAIENTPNTIITSHARYATFENITISIDENSTVNSVVASGHVYYSTFKDITVIAPNCTITSIFGTGDFYESSLNNIVITAKSVGKIGGQNANLVSIDNINVTATLTGIKQTLSNPIELKKTTTTDVELGLVFANANVTISYNALTVNATVNENGIVSFTNSDLFTEDDNGEQILTITGTKGNLTFTILLTVNVDNGITKLTVESSQDLIMSNKTVSLSMGDYVGYAVTAIKLGSYDLGTNASSLDVSLLKEDLTKHGVQTVIVRATYDGNEYEISYPVVVVTKALTTLLEIQNAVSIYSSEGTDKGAGAYYIIANDIDTNGLNYLYDNISYNGEKGCGTSDGSIGKGFHGTLDGRNHKISGYRYNSWGTLFGNIGENAVVKNITFDKLDAESDCSALFSVHMQGVTFENITITFVDNVNLSTKSVFASGYVQYCTFKNITVNAIGGNIKSIINASGYIENTLENIVVNVKTLAQIGGTGNSVVGIDNENVTVTYNKIEISQTELVKINKTTQDFILGTDYASATVTAMFNEKVVSGTTDENGKLTFTIADLFTSDDIGEQIVTVNAIIGKTTYVIALTVTVDSGIAKLTVESSQDLIMSNETVSLSMGDYAGYTVIAIKLGSYDLGTNASSLDVSLLKEDLTKHGVQTVIVRATYEGNEYEISYPVVVVTKALTTIHEIQDAVSCYSWNDVKNSNGYYIIANDISAEGLNYLHNNLQYNGDSDKWIQGGDLGKGFTGTLDGRNHKISGFRTSGFFMGNFTNATIKNIVFENIKVESDCNALLGNNSQSSTFENISVSFTADSVVSNALLSGNVYYSTFKDITVTAKGLAIGSIFGTSDFYESTYSNIQVSAKSLTAVAGKGTNLVSTDKITFTVNN